MSLLIGIDVGTTHLKAAAFTALGEQVAVAHVETPTNRLPNGGAEYDPELLWQGIATCLQRVTQAAPGPIAGVAVASMAEAGVLVAENGRPAHPALTWFDPRTRPQAEALAADPGRDALYYRTGLFVMPKHGMAKLLWLKENRPEAYAKGTTWLSMAEWIAFKLTGRRAACPTLAARTLAYDLTTGSWALDLVQHVDLRSELFPELVSEGAPTGTVTPEAANATGLPTGTVVALAGHDHPCASLAAGVTGPGQMLDSTGTAEAVIGCIPAPLLTPKALQMQISQGPLPVPGLVGLQAGAAAAGGSLEWLKREFFAGSSYADLTALAEAGGEEPTGLLYLPHLGGGGPPAVDPASKGALIGLTYSTTQGQVVKAVLEGTCYELRRMVEAMEQLTGVPFEQIVVTGGHTKNPLWLQLKADILGRELTVPEVAEATLLGAALLAGVAAGTYTSPQQAATSIQRPQRTIKPRPEQTEAYNRLYAAYAGLAPALRPFYQKEGYN